MTIEEIALLDMDGIEARAAQIREEMTVDGADIDALTAEATKLEERKAAIVEERAAAKADAEAVAAGAGDIINNNINEEKRKMTIDEIRNSAEYINAFAEYIKTGDDAECRALLSDHITVSGTAGVPTPTFVEDRIRTAWDNDEIMSRVRRTYVKGNLKVGFELSATAAAVHTEGAAAPAEETLALGVVELVPETIKKWLSVSDEVLDMHGEQFLNYIFDEIEYRIVKLAADRIVADIVGSPTTATTSAAAVSNLSISAASIHDFVDAVATLSDEARNPVIIMNKASYAAYKGLQMAANYGVDPFDGMPVLFNNTLYAVGAATDGQAIAIVGDLDGAQANFPNGDQPSFKYDDLSLAEKDLVKIVGRLPIAHDVTASDRFCVIKKAS